MFGKDDLGKIIEPPISGSKSAGKLGGYHRRFENPKWDICVTSFHPKLRDPPRRGGERVQDQK